jgi:secondary thiamine-phosphate synthase enzyme
MNEIQRLNIRTDKRNQLIDITEKVRAVVKGSGVSDGKVEIFVPHTTAAVTINENYDPTVQADILGFLANLVPPNAGYQHTEGNSDAHIKSSLIGTSVTVLIADGDLVFGTWQGIYFCEFDGPRNRQALVKIIPD